MPLLFISYRRDDTSGHAGRLHDHLCREFSEQDVFIDVDSIDSGSEWPRELYEQLRDAKVVILVIGRRWSVEALREPDDYVRQEILWALSMDKVIIPVLVEGARFPDVDLLPLELKDVASRMSQSLSGSSNRAYLEDLGRLIETVKSHLRKTLEHMRLSNTTGVTIHYAGGYLKWTLKGHDIPELQLLPGKDVSFEVKPGRYSFYIYYRHMNFGSGYMGRSSVHEGESNRWEGMLQAGQYRFECGVGSSGGLLGSILGSKKEQLYLKQLSFTPWPELE